MNKLSSPCFLFTALLVTALAGHALAQTPLPPPSSLGQMPIIQAETLSERKVTLPQDLPGEKTLALIAFERGQQTNINTWVDGLSLKTTTEPWVEQPVIEPRSSWSRAFIDGGMRMGIRDEAMRNRVITLYTERAAFLKLMGLPDSTRSIYAVVVTRAGQVLAMVEGDYTREKAAVLAKAFGQ
jgi:hypothetical protein